MRGNKHQAHVIIYFLFTCIEAHIVSHCLLSTVNTFNTVHLLLEGKNEPFRHENASGLTHDFFVR